MSNDSNPENRNSSKQQTDNLTTVVFEELDTDEVVRVIGGDGCPQPTPYPVPGPTPCPVPGPTPYPVPGPTPYPVPGPPPGGSRGHGGGCFVSGTLVRMADGSSKPIEEIEIGDQVLAYDDRVREVVPSRVAHKFVHPDIDDGLIRINGRLEATPYHVIYADDRYMRVDELKIGSMLLALSEAGIAQSEPTVVNSLERFHRKQTVYNLEIERQHTFFANGILVHNNKPRGMT